MLTIPLFDAPLARQGSELPVQAGSACTGCSHFRTIGSQLLTEGQHDDECLVVQHLTEGTSYKKAPNPKFWAW